MTHSKPIPKTLKIIVTLLVCFLSCLLVISVSGTVVLADDSGGGNNKPENPERVDAFKDWRNSGGDKLYQDEAGDYWWKKGSVYTKIGDEDKLYEKTMYHRTDYNGDEQNYPLTFDNGNPLVSTGDNDNGKIPLSVFEKYHGRHTDWDAQEVDGQWVVTASKGKEDDKEILFQGSVSYNGEGGVESYTRYTAWETVDGELRPIRGFTNEYDEGKLVTQWDEEYSYVDGQRITEARGYNQEEKDFNYKVCDGDGCSVYDKAGNCEGYCTDEHQQTHDVMARHTMFETIDYSLQSAMGWDVLSSLFLSEDTLREWREKVDEIFANMFLGVDSWVSHICQSDIKKESKSSLYAPSYGLNEIVANVKGEKTAIVGPNGTTYVYKFSYFINNPKADKKTFLGLGKVGGEEDRGVELPEIDFNVRLSGQRDVWLYNNPQKVKQGKTWDRTKRKTIVRYSDTSYDEICVVFSSEKPRDYMFKEVDKICDDINEYEGEPTAYTPEESGRTSDGRNDDERYREQREENEI